MNKKLKSFLIMLILIFMSIGCNKTVRSPKDTIESYLESLVNQNVDTAVSLSCKQWEAEAQKEVESLLSVNASLEGVLCQTDSELENNAVVSCRGKIKLTYENEIQEIDLSKRPYQLVFENGEWLICQNK